MNEILDFFYEYEQDIQDAKDSFDSALFIRNNMKDLCWITEATKNNKVGEKIKSGIKKLSNSVSKLVNYSKGKVISTLERKKSDKEFMKKQFELKGQDPSVVKRALDKSWDKIIKTKDDFMKQTGFGKISIPFANAVGWGPLVMVPGSVAILLGASSLIDFILDYKRRFLGQQRQAIDNFSDWIEKRMNTLEETDIYASDKIMSLFCQYMTHLGSELKRLSLAASQALGDNVQKGADKINKKADKLKDGKLKDKIKSVTKKTSEVVDEQRKDNDKVKQKYREYEKLNKKKREEGKIKREENQKIKDKQKGREWVYEYHDVLEDMPLYNINE